MQKNRNIEKISFQVVQMKLLAMHITNQKLSFDIFTVGNLQNIFTEHDLNILMIFGKKRTMDNFDPYNVLLSIATNIPVLLMTAFVLQGHIWLCFVEITMFLVSFFLSVDTDTVHLLYMLLFKSCFGSSCDFLISSCFWWLSVYYRGTKQISVLQ